MASRPKPQAFVIEGGGGKTYKVYGQPGDIQDTFGDLDLAGDEPELISVPVRTFSRRRYPGGPTSTVASTTRTQMDSPGESGTNATPGRPFWIETLENATSKKVVDVKQMTTTAPMATIVFTAVQNIGANKQIRTTGGRTFRGVTA
jgi:hypothetical protein